MKNIVVLLLLALGTSWSFAQLPQRPNLWDKDGLRTGQWIVYYDSAYSKKVSIEDSAKQYCLMTLVNGKPKGKVTCYYLNGIKQWDGHLSSIDPDIYEGLVTYYYPKGNVKYIINYKRDTINGAYIKYHENGTLAFKGELINNLYAGPWEYFHENGKILARGNYNLDLRIGVWEYFHENGRLQMSGNYTNDLKNGIWERYFDNGQLEYKAELKDDQNEGYWEVYYPNGQLSYSAYFTDGLTNGEFISYHENGFLEKKGLYKNDKRNGHFQYFQENGQLQSEGMIVDGLYQGKWDFYYANGQKSTECAYINDVQYGYFTYYYDNGFKKSEGQVANEQWNDTTIYYYPNGVVKERGKMEAGLKQGGWIYYYENGQLKATKTYLNDSIFGLWMRYFDNGQLNEKGNFVKDSKEGYWESFYANGNYDQKGAYQNDFRIGYHEDFHENGLLKSKGNYEAGKKVGKWVYYHDNGQISSEGLYANGLSTGEWIYYYADGRIKKRGHEKGDLEEGDWFTYYPTGQLNEERSYIAGKSEGLLKNYHPNGQLRHSGYARDDIGYGIWTFCDSLGRKEAEGRLKDNKKDGRWTFYDTLGQITIEGNLVNDQKQGPWQYYKDNKKSHVTIFDRNVERDFHTLSDSARIVAKRHDLKGALRIAKEAKKYLDKVKGNQLERPYDYNRLLGSIYYYVGDYDKALDYCNKAKSEIELKANTNSNTYAYLLNDMALTYSGMDEHDLSNQYQLQSLSTLDKTIGRHHDNYYIIFHNLCSSYTENKQFQEAKALLEQDLKYRKDSVREQSVHILSDLDDIAEIIYRTGEFEASILAYKSVLHFIDSTKMNNRIEKLDAYRYTAYCFDGLNQMDSAIYYYQKAIQAHKLQGKVGSSTFAYNYIYLSSYYYDINQHHLAIQYADTAIAVSESNDLFNNPCYIESLLRKARPEFALYHTQVAYEYYTRANEFALSKNGTEIKFLAQSYQGKALCESRIYPSKPEIAIASYQKAIQLYQPDSIFASTYFNGHLLLGEYYNKNNQHTNALQIFYHLKSYLSTFEEDLPYFKGELFENIGDGHYYLDQFDSAMAYYDQSAAAFGANLDLYATEYGDVLISIALLHSKQGNSELGIPFILRAMETIEKRYGKAHINYAGYQADLAYLFSRSSNYPNAIATYKAALENKASLLGKSNPSYVNSQLSLVLAYNWNSDYQLALTLLEDIRTNLLSYSDVSDIKYLRYLEYKGNALSHQGKISEAEPLFKEMVKRSQSFYGAEHIEHAYVLKQVADFYQYNKKLDKALLYLTPAISIVENVKGRQSTKYAEYTEALAEIYFTQDKYFLSLEIKKANLPIYEKEYGKNSVSYIDSYLKFIGQLRATGQFAESIERYNALEPLIDQMFGSISLYKSNYYESIGVTYREWGKPETALTFANQVIDILDSIAAHESHYYSVYQLKARCLLNMNRLDEGEDLYLKIKELVIRNWGKTSSYYATLNNMSFVYLEKGDFVHAEKLMLEAVKLFDTHAVVTDADIVNYEDNLANLYLAWGKLDKADKYWTHVTELLLKNISNNFAYMSESEKANYWKNYRGDFEYFNTFAIKAKDQIPRAIGDMYNNQLQTKSILLSASTKERRRIINSGDSLLITQYNDYIDLKEHLVKVYGYTKEQLVEEKINIDSLERLTNTLEGKLSLDASALSQEEKAKKIKWQDIQRSLTKDEASVEIIRFNYFDRHETDSVIYAALILTQETKHYPELVILPNGNELEEKYLKNYMTSIKFKSKDDYSYAKYWKAIDDKIKGKTMVYFSPDGVYNQLNINTFQRENSTYILDAYRLQIMTSTRDVVLINKETKKAVDIRFASLFGFPQYDLDHASINEYVQERSMERSRSQERDIDLDRFGFSELPGTKTETESIENLLSENNWQTSLYLGHEALEEHLKMVNSPDVLHIATHGYFLEDTNESTNKIQLGINTNKGKTNPMLRSGLLLAGAAQTAMGNSSNQVENGIFTAYEAMNLNLNNTELVVLSACETGKGEVKSGEGVYGLQRAFQIAGTKALIMSLWKVSDEATQLLMTRFYSEWIAGKTKSEAFLSAQQQVRSKYKEPYYWGAFILLGE